MDSQSSEDTVSIASDEAFEDFRVEAFCDASADAPTETQMLPTASADGIISRLYRLIQLMEQQLYHASGAEPTREAPTVVAPMAATIAKRQSVSSRTKARAKARAKAQPRVFQQRAARVPPAHGLSTREKYAAAKRRKSERPFSSRWPESEGPYDKDGSYRMCTVYENKRASMAW